MYKNNNIRKSTRRLVFLPTLLLFGFLLRPLHGAEFTFEGDVRDVSSWTVNQLPRMTVFLNIKGTDPMLYELRIVIVPDGGKVEDVTWMGKNAADLTKSERNLPDLKRAVKGRRFTITFAGPRFDSADQDKLRIVGFKWLAEAN